MPEYSDEAPPPPRSQADVDKLLAGADASAPPDAADAKPLRIVLVAGDKDHGKGEHDYPNWQKVWAPMLAKAPHTTIDAAWDFPSQEQSDNADVLVFYQRGRWNDERAAAIDPFLARGGGCVYIHWAVDGQGGQEEFAKLSAKFEAADGNDTLGEANARLQALYEERSEFITEDATGFVWLYLQK